ncbi:MAG TPA: ABC transporter permease [Vicinamibacterales bacterium]|nr:ABC transporter permease [Vicinamibacterales bacterium]
MAIIGEWIRRLGYLLRRGAVEDDLRREMEAHRALMEEPRAFGNTLRLRDEARDAWGWTWLDDFVQDTRFALRTLRRSPGFALTAVVTLAFGIGVNTAIFSVWNGVLYAPLPGVHRPEDLVLLTDPGASGMVRGHLSGARRWLTYAEFEGLRDHATGFSGLMASQSSLNTWRVRVDDGAPEDTSGRLVSGEFFGVLGVHPTIGRLFTTTEDRGEPSSAVISHAYWQRRFGGRPDVIGTTLIVRDTPVSVVGVAPADFVGETSGQQPDLWLPLRLQPRVLPGGDWLHEKPPDKVMWLHVFGRLKAGITYAQAEAQASAVFQTGLESFYGAERQRELLDQRLRLQPGARGASASRNELSSSLTMLLASAAVLLLITCANLANLLFARGAARHTEIAVRLSLGARRERVVRQLVTESLALATLGGIVAIAAAAVMHGALVRMLQDAEPSFFMGFAFTLPVLVFVLAATLIAALACGALPAWHMIRTDSSLRLKDNSRGTIGSSSERRSGRWLVGVQLALCLPLLVGAGLLVRTVYNLQRPDLRFDAERLLLAQVDLGAIVQDVPRRDRVLRELLARIHRIPGVEAASFSQLGLFRGGMSTATIEVSGSDATATRGRDSALDRVGASYFTTLRIRILRGRDIADNDRADTYKVCIVNEAFVQAHFGGHDPLGMRVTTVDDGVRTTYEVVGVVGDARTQTVRGDVEPRFFVPAEQRPSQGTSRTFLIRRAASAAGVMPAVRNALNGVDPRLSSFDLDLASVEEHMAPSSADARTTARLAVVFGTVALTLSAIGLYGVLAYGITRRSNEIAIRMALGAHSRGIIAMILHETAGLVVAGLLVGSALTYLGSRMITSRLYGVAPWDPLTLALATGVLLLVVLIAAYLPAHRASRVDPMTALHQG